MAGAALRILVADDHVLFRDGLRQVLGNLAPDVVVVEAANLAGACAALAGDGPMDLGLIDLHMPGMAGPDSLDVIRAVAPGVPLLVISGDDDPAQVARVRAAGAEGFVSKTAGVADLLAAIRLVLAGGAAFPVPTALPPGPGGHRLTDRQVAILAMMANGASNKEIANDLGIAIQTVKNHGASIMRLLEARNRTAAVQAALRLGIIAPPRPPGSAGKP